jgi:GrpB-like predicted nucleotidyltransferase (UPF0157 family)
VPVVGIEHVGSTSVPGLAAKPIIDVDIVVLAAAVEAAIAALATIGYESMNEMSVPQQWMCRAPEDEIQTNTYVVVDGSLSLRNHIGVRDVLRSDDALRTEYADVKKRLARDVDDIDEYVEGKSAVLQRILERGGLTDDERATIGEINRRPT